MPRSELLTHCVAIASRVHLEALGAAADVEMHIHGLLAAIKRGAAEACSNTDEQVEVRRQAASATSFVPDTKLLGKQQLCSLKAKARESVGCATVMQSTESGCIQCILSNLNKPLETALRSSGWTVH